jgi:Xaa-Pro dipeptidase
MLQELYARHIERLVGLYTESLLTTDAAGILLHSGSAAHYYADDREISFQAYGHFLHWIAVNRPDQFLLIRPGQKPVYYQIVPSDFWYEQEIQDDPMWLEAFEIVRLESVAQISGQLADQPLVYLGDKPDIAKSLGIDTTLCNPQQLLHFLDYHRAWKSEFEIEQLKEANRLALIGHEAARECFLAGGSEYDIHLAYLGACKILEDETPYTNIVALNEKSAILHYQNKRRNSEDNRVLLIDAGYRVRGYGSDITRTTASDSANPLFRALLAGMEALELDLIAQLVPGKSYVDIHLAALRGVADLLLELEICSGSKEALWDAQLPQLFMPHGVGHLLGINVHDAGGRMQDETGTTLAPPAHSPMLRNTRTMTEDMVFTIEPGCYFIPMLLEPERTQKRGKLINWQSVEQLYSHGGIRVEDNVRVGADAAENLTRQFE